jgi:hypothetical protein
VRIAESRPDSINLLITDVGVEGIARTKLADRVLELKTPVSPDELLRAVRKAIK